MEVALKTDRAIRPFVTACSDRLRELWKDLNRLGEEFTPRQSAETADAPDQDPLTPFFGPLAETFARGRQQMVEQLDEAIRSSFFTPQRRLQDVFSDGPEVRAELVVLMRSAARKVFLHCVRDADLARLREAMTAEGVRELTAPLRSCRDRATPKLLGLTGGAKRLLLAAPRSLDGERLGEKFREAIGDPATAVPGAWHEALVCYEAESLTLDRIAGRFLRVRPDCQELASRLHTRIDVSW